MVEKKAKTLSTKKTALVLCVLFLLASFGIYIGFHFKPATKEPDEIMTATAISAQKFSVRTTGAVASINVSGYLVKFSVVDSNGENKTIEIPVTTENYRKKIFGKKVKIAKYKNWLTFQNNYEIYE